MRNGIGKLQLWAQFEFEMISELVRHGLCSIIHGGPARPLCRKTESGARLSVLFILSNWIPYPQV